MDNPTTAIPTDVTDPKTQEKSNEAIINAYDIPETESHSSFNALKDRIRHHYELASDYYYRLWYLTYFTPPSPHRYHVLMEISGVNTSITGTSLIPQTPKRKPRFNS